MKDNTKGVILCLLSAFCYAVGPVFGKLLFSVGLPWQVLAPVRGMIPALLIALHGLFFARHIFKVRKEDLKWHFCNGICFAMICICNYCAVYYINASVSQVLLYTQAIYTVILGRLLLKEKITIQKAVATIAIFSGVICIINIVNIDHIAAQPDLFLFGIPSVVIGIVMGLMSGFLSAVYTLCTRMLNGRYDGWTVNSWCFFFGFPVFFLIGFRPALAFDWDLRVFLFLLLMSLIGLAAYSLYAICMHYIDAGKASLIVTVDPVISISLSVLILGEAISGLQFIGIFLVAAGILFMELGQPLIDKWKKKPIKE